MSGGRVSYTAGLPASLDIILTPVSRGIIFLFGLEDTPPVISQTHAIYILGA